MYASQDDIIARYTERVLPLNADGDIDTDAVNTALLDASHQIDAYSGSTLGNRVQLCVDIAVYRMAAAADILTDDCRARYQDALAFLRSQASVSSETGLQQVQLTSQPPLFARPNMGRIT